jgi:hypothetical protein
VAAFLARSRIPRARATQKLKEVLRRVGAEEPPVDRVRELWAFGSFARGAPEVGDVDLYILVDEPRTPQRFSLDLIYDRRRPFADQIAAMGCGGSSFVSVQGHPVFDAPGEPASPERLASAAASAAQWVPVKEPIIRHIVTGEPLAGPFLLLWARGDELDWALKRLHGIAERPDAGRHERTTTVPLLDDLSGNLGLETSFALAAQVRRANIACRAYLLHHAQAPATARRALAERYFNPARKAPSIREIAGSAALHHLAVAGTDLRDVLFVDAPVTQNSRTPRVFVDFNPFQLYLAAAGSYHTGDRLVHVWPSRRTGPWLAMELEVLDEDGVLELHHWLTAMEEGQEARAVRLLEVLSEPVAKQS